ncbi:MAG: hypothetical protein KDC80_11370, partial [Saprospiraceae bacterium]|nr:hypothetical protein [Saprospiraceae bacterium]
MENYSNEEIKKKLLRAKKAELVTLIKDLVDGDPSLTEKVLVFLSSASTPNKHKTLIYRYINR